MQIHGAAGFAIKEGEKRMLKKISTIAATAVLALSMSVTSFGTAQAHGWGHGHGGAVAGALVGGLALGVLASEAGRSRECVRECRWVPRGCWRDEDGYKVCRPGREVCRRYCD
jgi:hypothetical protein